MEDRNNSEGPRAISQRHTVFWRDVSLRKAISLREMHWFFFTMLFSVRRKRMSHRDAKTHTGAVHFLWTKWCEWMISDQAWLPVQAFTQRIKDNDSTRTCSRTQRLIGGRLKLEQKQAQCFNLTSTPRLWHLCDYHG